MFWLLRFVPMPLGEGRLLLHFGRFRKSLIYPPNHHANNEKALEVAIQYKISAYDARFLAVAIETGLRPTTEDKRLRIAAPELTQSLAEALIRTA